MSYALDWETTACLRQQLTGTLEGLRQSRWSFWAHWSRLAEMFLPRRYKWFVTTNQANRGAQLNSAIVDETGVLAARTLAAGMMSGMTSPTKQWFSMGLHDLEYIPYGPVKTWLAEVERRILRVLAESNFYTSLGTFYHDLGVFGSASQIIYEDPEQVIRCFNPCLGEFFFGANARLEVDQLYREFTYTIDQVVQQFGLDAVSAQVKQAYMQGGTQRQREIVICHAIEPNTRLWKDETSPLRFVVPTKFRYREVYWEQADGMTGVLTCAGYNEKPFVGGRWDIVSNDAYGRSPGMDALPAVTQLQIEQRRKAEAIDKIVRPPMVASVNMKNEPASILPGAVTYAASLGADSGFKPAFQIDPRISEMTQDIAEVQDRVNRVFFVDLFLMIASLDTVRTATEIDARREEKLIQLGPVIERFENEVLDPIIERVFGIMVRRGLIPDPPEEIGGQEINVQYISMLATAQKAAKTASTERFLALVGNLAGVEPSVLDVADTDALLSDYADNLDVIPRGIRGPEALAELRQKREEQAQQEQALQATMEGVQGAKTLSETQVGGGQNALAAVIGGLG